MNPYKTLLLSATLSLCSVAVAQSQTKVRIGETIVTLQSPLQVQPADQDSIKTDYSIFTQKKSRSASYPRHTQSTYIGFGLAVPFHHSDCFPILGGNSFNIEVGARYLYHPSRHYAIGTFLQYSCYSYRLKDASMTFIDHIPEGKIYKEFFRTDNIGTGIVQRVRLFSNTQLEAVVYGDYAYSKRYIVKSRVDGNKVKDKFRDQTKFNPFGAGLQAGIKYRITLLYARYRLTNFFNHDCIPHEVTRLSIGINYTL